MEIICGIFEDKKGNDGGRGTSGSQRREHIGTERVESSDRERPESKNAD